MAPQGKLQLCAALLSAVGLVVGQNTTWDHSLYTTSPPVYPSPNATGLAWESAFAQARNFVAQLTLEEKAQLVTGTAGPCVGNIAPIPRLGFLGLCLQDGPLAIRQADYASVFPAGLTAAASWEKGLIYQRGLDIGAEFKGKGAHIALGPVAGPLGRSGYGGRNWEGFSPDPYLTGVAFEMTIQAMQRSGVQATAKHYIGNEQETQRNPSLSPNNVTIEALSSNIDDRTMHEVYLWPFQNAVRVGVASMMCSYNRINGSYGCQNSKALNGLLKDELGFQGYVMSDWEAVHSGVASIEAGLDMNMPGGIAFTVPTPSFWGANITLAVNNGSLNVDRLDDMCRRIMTPYFHLHQNVNYPPIDGSEGDLNFFPLSSYVYNFTKGPSNIDVRDNHAGLIRELGAAGTVLLKNKNNILPLKAPKNIGVFGNDAGDLTNGLYSLAGGFASGDYEYGTLAVAGGSGTGRLTYVVPPLEAIKARARQDGSLVQYILNNTLLTSGSGFSSIFPTPPEVCLVFLKTWATEGYDRTTLLADWNSTAVVNAVAAYCNNTIVVTHSGGLNTLPFANHPNVTAILAAHLPGQETGNSIVDILYGAVNPSGKLPYTIALQESDYAFADITNSTALLETENPDAWQSDFTEQLLIDYRHFDYHNQTVAYEFGFGLSYTTFGLSNLTVRNVYAAGNISATPPRAAVVPGGNPTLWDVLYRATATITNTGRVAGAAVPQLYLSLPQLLGETAVTPPKVLRGFEKVSLQPGQSAMVSFDFVRRDLSSWDTRKQMWTIAPGRIGVMAGFSSRDIRGQTSFAPLS
ncbi:hypothetical protein LTR50_003600 [Elasticomyces elasticus]|nr:hypothetical protein LTR50_003600 [Elasticomyces elasticus]